MARQFSFSLNNNLIHTYEYGNGPRLLILFHGFDESGAEYGTLGDRLGKEYTVLIPDLPYHGQTQWTTGVLSPALLIEMAGILMRHRGVSKCSILGYSMGGRLALCLAQQRTVLIDRLILLAPEGLRKNRWFDFATHTLIGRILFRWITSRPGPLLFLLKISRKGGLISSDLANFVKKYMNTTEKRFLVYRMWMCFRKLHIKRRNIFGSLTRHKVPLWICLGRYDRLIPLKTTNKIKPSPFVRITTAECGHRLLLHEPVLNNIYTYLCLPGRT